VKPYGISLFLGALAGLIYGVTGQRSPAPPIIALVGLFGMLIGAQVPPLLKDVVTGNVPFSTWIEQQLNPQTSPDPSSSERATDHIPISKENTP
jgi:XapX domain-containing protein